MFEKYNYEVSPGGYDKENSETLSILVSQTV